MRPEDFCTDEYTDYIVYNKLAEREKDERLKSVLMDLARIEKGHYEFWLKYTHDFKPRAKKSVLILLLLIRKFLGLTFTLKLLERHERDVIRNYKIFLDKVRSEDKHILESIIRDEEEHENFFISKIDERVVRYMGSIMLGLSDALIELVGVLAGTVAAFRSTILAGITGLIVGVAASASMASAAYLQAKHELGRSPISSAFFTGLSYIITVILLIIPFFLTSEIMISLVLSLLIAILIVAFTSFYSAILFDRRLITSFIEASILTLGIGLGVYLFGEFVRYIIGVNLNI